MARILIIEDELSIQKMIEYDLKQLNYEIDSALDGFEGYKKASSTLYDVILLDIMLPNMNGLDICKKLRQEGNEAYIIMLTAMDDEYNKIKGFEIGADDYVTKPFSPRELAARIKAGLRRKGVSKNDDTLYYNNLKVVQSSYQVFNGNEKVELTLKEFELLVYLIINKGKALSRDQLLNKLWGFSYDGDSRVVDVHIFKLRDKLDPKAEFLKTVRGIGYILI
ncbi:response regulator transcription factor [Candidatus Izimaplasma bacterium ZiA1]|uniref:response regulator transcription factor n=1 Tax=Candidatus Izimoplasma sp. ZiA1 TaxID=2024899 RepID=UPI00196AF679